MKSPPSNFFRDLRFFLKLIVNSDYLIYAIIFVLVLGVVMSSLVAAFGILNAVKIVSITWVFAALGLKVLFRRREAKRQQRLHAIKQILSDSHVQAIFTGNYDRIFLDGFSEPKQKSDVVNNAFEVGFFVGAGASIKEKETKNRNLLIHCLNICYWFCGKDTRAEIQLISADLRRDVRDLKAQGYDCWFIQCVLFWQVARTMVRILWNGFARIFNAVVPFAKYIKL